MPQLQHRRQDRGRHRRIRGAQHIGRARHGGLSASSSISNGHVRAQFDGDPSTWSTAKRASDATGPLKDARFWSPKTPTSTTSTPSSRWTARWSTSIRIETGFRKTEFKGGAGTGGVYINDKFVYLKGFSERSSDEWAGVGAGYPDWMHDFTAQMIRDCHANYMRWMHISPQKVDADSFDRFGIVQVCPAGDKESDVTGASGTSAPR
jgi:beta-galactosidase